MRLDQPKPTATSILERLAEHSTLTLLDDLGIWLKDERAMPTGSFKVRGAAAWVAETDDDRPIFTGSSGNHGRALAWVLRAAGDSRPLTVVVTTSADPNKVRCLADAGCTVVLVEGDNEARDQLARELAFSSGGSFCSSHDDPLVIAGHAVVGDEILAAQPAVRSIFVPVGGGGLFAGVSLAASRRGASVKIVGAEPTGANAMSASLAARRRVRLDTVETECDALRSNRPGEICLKVIMRCGGQVIEVTDTEVAEARALLTDRIGPVELSAAAGVAGAIKAGASDAVCVVTGAPPLGPRAR